MFQVINGGGQKPALTTAEAKAKFQQLRTIDIAMLRSGQSINGPRFGRATMAGAAVCVALLGLSYLVENSGLAPWATLPPDVRHALFWLPYALGFGVFLWVNVKSSYPRTWVDLIDAKLAGYEPVDREAYRRLQQRTRDAGFLDYHEVREWVLMERHAVEIASGRLTPSRETFLRKKV